MYNDNRAIVSHVSQWNDVGKCKYIYSMWGFVFQFRKLYITLCMKVMSYMQIIRTGTQWKKVGKPYSALKWLNIMRVNLIVYE